MNDPAKEAPERLQKVLAALGLGSRRTIEEWIRGGRVSVNGVIAELGARVGPSDRVLIDGKPIDLAQRAHTEAPVVLGYHKPVGEMTTRSDPRSPDRLRAFASAALGAMDRRRSSGCEYLRATALHDRR